VPLPCHPCLKGTNRLRVLRPSEFSHLRARRHARDGPLRRDQDTLSPTYRFLSFLICAQLAAALARAVLDQVTPDVCLVSSKADDRFIDLCSDSSMNFFIHGRVVYARSGTYLALQWLLLEASFRYDPRKISDRREGATMSCLWGSSPTFPKTFLIHLTSVHPQSRGMRTNL